MAVYICACAISTNIIIHVSTNINYVDVGSLTPLKRIEYTRYHTGTIQLVRMVHCIYYNFQKNNKKNNVILLSLKIAIVIENRADSREIPLLRNLILGFIVKVPH